MSNGPIVRDYELTMPVDLELNTCRHLAKYICSRNKLSELDLLLLESRKFRGDQIETFKIVKGPVGNCSEPVFREDVTQEPIKWKELLKQRSRLAVSAHLFSKGGN